MFIWAVGMTPRLLDSMINWSRLVIYMHRKSCSGMKVMPYLYYCNIGFWHSTSLMLFMQIIETIDCSKTTKFPPYAAQESEMFNGVLLCDQLWKFPLYWHTIEICTNNEIWWFLCKILGIWSWLIEAPLENLLRPLCNWLLYVSEFYLVSMTTQVLMLWVVISMKLSIQTNCFIEASLKLDSRVT